MSRLILTIQCIALSFLFSCGGKEPDPVTYNPTPYELEIPKYFPTNLNIPADNPLTVEGITLGRYLFYDGRLSGRTQHDSLISCGSCHVQSRNFEPGIDHPIFQNGKTFGLSGAETPHYPLPLINLVWNQNGYFWNGYIDESNPDYSRRRLEDVVWMGVTAPHEMNGDTNQTKALIQSIPGYADLFLNAFGSNTVTMNNISKAIAQFARTLVSANSKFDRYMLGEEQLTQQEINGFILFTTEEGADCFHCHGSSGNPLFTTNLFYNNGKDTIFDDPRDRYAITGLTKDKGAYKATTLRNISLGGPYMHDGRYETLDDVIDFYSHHVKMSPYVNPLMHHVAENGVQLTPVEKAELKAFILTLHDTEFLTNPDFGPPMVFPDGSTYEQVAGRFYGIR
ncbi:MAG: cytochrome c peroxidase [Lentimicrobium sp.]|jgi:cytochrome c peroxidase|nr:cytochrome c peroxidase [Lentimicrobium sp.]